MATTSFNLTISYDDDIPADDPSTEDDDAGLAARKQRLADVETALAQIVNPEAQAAHAFFLTTLGLLSEADLTDLTGVKFSISPTYTRVETHTVEG